MRHLNNGTDHRHSKSRCDQSSPARRTIMWMLLSACIKTSPQFQHSFAVEGLKHVSYDFSSHSHKSVFLCFSICYYYVRCFAMDRRHLVITVFPLVWDWIWIPRNGYHYLLTWWPHQMETFSALLAKCAGNSPVTGEFPVQMPVARSFDVFFDLRLNKWLSKQS